MPRLILRLAIALVAFSAGVTAATIYNAIFGAPTASSFIEMKRPDPPRKRPCPHSRNLLNELPPPPPPPAAPELPPPPPAKSEPTLKKRVRIELPDGAVRVIESHGEKRAELKF